MTQQALALDVPTRQETPVDWQVWKRAAGCVIWRHATRHGGRAYKATCERTREQVALLIDQTAAGGTIGGHIDRCYALVQGPDAPVKTVTDWLAALEHRVRLTTRDQYDVFLMVRRHNGITTSRVSQLTRVPASRARTALRTLERRHLITRDRAGREHRWHALHHHPLTTPKGDTHA